MAIWYSTVPVWFNFVSSICIYSVTFTTIHYSCTTHSSISVLSVISDMRNLCVSKWQINIFKVLNVLVWKTAKIIIWTKFLYSFVFNACIDGSFWTHVCKLDAMTQNLEKNIIIIICGHCKNIFKIFMDHGIYRSGNVKCWNKLISKDNISVHIYLIFK